MVKIQEDNVDWVILKILKSHQVSFPIYLSNIVHFVCGYHQNLFLDSEGNVFSVGYNSFGELGLGHNTNQNVLSKIPNIPPIKIISCVSASSYLIDFEGNLWSFGYNEKGQLGNGFSSHINVPQILNTLKIFNKYHMVLVGSIFLPKTLRIKYSPLGITIADNLEQETLNHFQFPKKSIHNILPFGETNTAVELKVQGSDSLVWSYWDIFLIEIFKLRRVYCQPILISQFNKNNLSTMSFHKCRFIFFKKIPVFKKRYLPSLANFQTKHS